MYVLQRTNFFGNRVVEIGPCVKIDLNTHHYIVGFIQHFNIVVMNIATSASNPVLPHFTEQQITINLTHLQRGLYCSSSQCLVVRDAVEGKHT